MRRIFSVVCGTSLLLSIVAAVPAAADAQVRNPGDPSYVVGLTTGGRGRVWTGIESVTFRNVSTQPMDMVWFRLWSNGEVTVREPHTPCDQVPIQVSNIAGATAGALQVGCTALPVTLSTVLPPGAMGTVSMDVQIRLPKQNERFGWFHGLARLGTALPTLAVSDDAGWHLDPYVTFGESFYSIVGDYRVTLTTPPELHTPATGSLEGRTMTPDGLEARTYVATDVRDFAWAAGAFRKRSRVDADGTTVSVWFWETVPARFGKEVARQAARSMNALSRSFGAYPYPEVDIVLGAGESFGGMEYPQLIFSDPDRYIVAHELAHQWWYGIVGDNEYLEPWLDESFATWSMWLPGGKGRGWPPVPWVGCQMLDWPNDKVRITSSIAYFARHPEDYWVVYWQGGCALAHLAKVFGYERFLQVLKDYAASQWLGVATTADFQAAIEAAAAADGLDWDPKTFWARWRIGEPGTTPPGGGAGTG